MKNGAVCFLSRVLFATAFLVFGSLSVEGLLRTTSAANPTQQTMRVQSGLQALYTFNTTRGNTTRGDVVKDRSGVGKPIDLRISNPRAVRRKAGSLEVTGKTVIRSGKSAQKMIDAVRRSGELTIEAWIRPSKTTLSGPARIVTLSKDSGGRNFTLGQDKDRFDARLRTTSTSTNGIPSLASNKKSLNTKLVHVVYTHDRSGRTRIYINGKKDVERTVSGTTSNWDKNFQFALANELSNDRPWQGTFYLVALYSRDLSQAEVLQNFRAGKDGKTILVAKQDPKELLFETQIAPLLAKNCLECHDSSSREGGVDLSRKTTAFAGVENGNVLVSGKSASSLLWKSVQSDEMPLDHDPLTKKQKMLLKNWIDSGAVWSLDQIDRAVYVNHGKALGVWVQRLSVTEYIETVKQTMGVDIAKEARQILPADLRADGFSNTAYNLNVDLKHVESYAKLAEIVVSKMDVKKFASRFTKDHQLRDKNISRLITNMGKWVFRGPLQDHEITGYQGIATSVSSANGNFEEAVRYILEAMLQSPRFIYRMENQRGDGEAIPVDDYELASRLSYILWGGPPDFELMNAADAHRLTDRQQVEKQIDRMLKSPRAIERSTQFISEWLNLSRLKNLSPSRKQFPNWDQELSKDMRDETIAFFRDVVWTQKKPLSSLMNAQVTFATPRLAKHYGLKPKGNGLQRYDLSGVPSRGGLLTHGSVLTIGGDRASMVTRGLFILHDLLRGIVGEPPPGLDTTPVATEPGLPQRRISEKRLASSACVGCHKKIEPLAFGLEKFDGIGAFHEKDEHGNKLRHDGKILFPGEGEPVAYQTSAELMTLLAKSERVRETMTWKVTQFALGRPLGVEDARTVRKIHTISQKAGGTYPVLMKAIVLSDFVRMTRTVKADANRE